MIHGPLIMVRQKHSPVIDVQRLIHVSGGEIKIARAKDPGQQQDETERQPSIHGHLLARDNGNIANRYGSGNYPDRSRRSRGTHGLVVQIQKKHVTPSHNSRSLRFSSPRRTLGITVCRWLADLCEGYTKNGAYSLPLTLD